jgi:two-component system, sensor histidine kinase and response regulator
MKSVLIAEDEEALLEVMSAVVADLGHKVLMAQDGAEALTLARSHQPDLVITDHMMPRLTGMGLLGALRSEPALKDTPVILVSAARPAGAENATLYLAKPVPLDRFEKAVQSCLQGAPGTSPRPAEVALTYDERSALSLAKTEMLSWVAHEIKTPLSSARMNLQLMLRHPSVADEAPQRKKGESILRQLERMDQLVSSVLEAASLADGAVRLKLERQDLKGFLEGLISYWKDVKPEVQFTLLLPELPVLLNADAERLRQILDNLISNAVKYGSPVSRVQVALEQSPGRASIQVTDFGPGIDAVELARIFDRFHRAEGAVGKGHGLGLYIASALAKLHGGTLHAKSQRGEGATFTLSLPSTR